MATGQREAGHSQTRLFHGSASAAPQLALVGTASQPLRPDESPRRVDANGTRAGIRTGSKGPSRGGRFVVRRVVAGPLDTRGTRPRAP